MGDDLSLFLQEIEEVEKKAASGEIPLEDTPLLPSQQAPTTAKTSEPTVKDGKIFIPDEDSSKPKVAAEDDDGKPPPAKRMAIGFNAVPRAIASKTIAKAAVIAKPAMITAPPVVPAAALVEPYPGAFGGAPPPTGSALLPTPALPSVAATATKTAPAVPAAAVPAPPTTAPPTIATVSGVKRKTLRTCGGEVWQDATLMEWPENDFRLFVGDLGNEVTEDMLAAPFRKYASFAKGKIVRDKKTHKSRGYGFVSFLDPMDALNALKEMNGEYIGNRPIKLRKSTWSEKSYSEVKKKDREFNKRLGIT